jgi:hypothetical protein
MKNRTWKAGGRSVMVRYKCGGKVALGGGRGGGGTAAGGTRSSPYFHLAVASGLVSGALFAAGVYTLADPDSVLPQPTPVQQQGSPGVLLTVAVVTGSLLLYLSPTCCRCWPSTT